MYPCTPELPKEIKDLTLLDLPLKSQYRSLLFYGVANGTLLGKAFNNEDVRKRFIIIKSVRLVPYTVAAYIDFFVTDSGATETWSETIPADCRINRIFDSYTEGAEVQLLINGSPISLFSAIDPATDAVKGYPADLFLDNIYYLYPERLVDLDMSVDLKMFDDIDAGTTVNPTMKVVIECYLI